MKIIRLLSLLLLVSPFCARAVPTFSLSEKWYVQAFYENRGGDLRVPVFTNATAVMSFSGLKMTNAGPITASTQFSVIVGNVLITVPLSGDNTDTNNPIVSSYMTGKTSATVTFYHRNGHANPQMEVIKTVHLSWANNLLSGSIIGRKDTFGFLTPILGSAIPSTSTKVLSAAKFQFSFGNFHSALAYDYKLTNSVTELHASVYGYKRFVGGVIGTSRFHSPALTITSPVPNFSTTNPIVEVSGANAAFHGTGPTLWRWAAPMDDPSLDPQFFAWKDVDHTGTLQTNRTLWSTSVQLGPGTNWFWAVTSDSIGNTSAIVTRKIYYSVPRLLMLGSNGNGIVIGSKGVTNGAMLDIGRACTVTGTPNDTNTIFRDWRDGSTNVISTVSPWNFVMQSNMTIVGNFVPNPFPAIAGTYCGLFYDVTNYGWNVGSAATSGYAVITVTPDGSYTGNVLFGTNSYTIAGKLVFDADFDDADAVNADFATTNPSLSGHIRFASDGSGNLLPTPTISMSISNQILQPLPLLQSSTNAVAPGQYNFVDMADGFDPSVGGTTGSTCGSITVTTNGRANVVMRVADDSPAMSFSTPVCNDGTVPIFIPLYNGQGMVFATMNLTHLYPFEESDGVWVKPADVNAAVYPRGLTNAMIFNVARYTPDMGISMLSNYGVAAIGFGFYTNSYSARFVYWPANNQIIALPDQTNVTLNVTFDPASGFIGGTMTIDGSDPFDLKIMLPQGGGYTVDGNQSDGAGVGGVGLLDSYDDGFVLLGNNWKWTNGVIGTANFGYNDATQLTSTPTLPAPHQALVLHKAIQIAPHREVLINDAFENMFYVDPLSFLPIPAAPYTNSAPYVPSPYPAVSDYPLERTVQYIAN